MLKKSQVLKEGREMGIRDAINAIEARLLKETPIYDEESAQRLNTREISDVRRVLLHELKNNP